MKAVSVINFKGGVGKTTLSYHLACYLAKKAKVLLVDVDHQSSLSIVALGAKAWETQVKSGLTINKLFSSYTNHRNVSFPKSEIIYNLSNRKEFCIDYKNIDLVYSEFNLDDTEIDIASTFLSTPALADWEKRTLIASWLDGINASDFYDYVIFDCPPATKIVSQNALIASHGYIIPVIPDAISTRGVTHFVSLVSNKIDKKIQSYRDYSRTKNIPTAFVPTTTLLGIVPSLVKTAGNAASGITNIHTDELAELSVRWGADVTNQILTHRIGIPEALNVGCPIWYYGGGNAKGDLILMYEQLCDELKQRIDAL